MWLLLVVLSFLAACASPHQAACGEAGQCADYRYAGAYGRLDVVEERCAGTFTYGGTCPDGAIATCTFHDGSATSVHRYYAPDFTIETARIACETVVDGTFAPS